MYSSASVNGKHHAEFYVMNAAFVDMKTETLFGSGVLSQKMSTILSHSMENRHKQIAEIANAPSKNGQGYVRAGRSREELLRQRGNFVLLYPSISVSL